MTETVVLFGLDVLQAKEKTVKKETNLEDNNVVTNVEEKNVPKEMAFYVNSHVGCFLFTLNNVLLNYLYDNVL